MVKIIKNSFGNFLIFCLIFIIVNVWIFFGCPQIWQEPAVPPQIQQVRAEVKPLKFGNKAVDFTYTDRNEGENLIIRTDQKEYIGLTRAEVYFSVTNIGDKAEKVSFQIHFPEDKGNVKKIEKWTKNVPYEVEMPDYGPVGYFCQEGWQDLTEALENEEPWNTFRCESTGEVKNCDSLNEEKTNCIVNNVQIGSHKETRYKNKWQSINLSAKPLEIKQGFFKKIFGREVRRRPIPESFKVKKSTGGNGFFIEPNQTQYFKMEISFPVNSSGEFYIEAIGDKEGYGLLDPWWNSNWNYRKSHTINGTTAGAQSNYAIQIMVHYGSGTDSGDDVYLNSHCQTDFDDIRFTKSDGSTELDYFLDEKTDSDVARFWVEIDSIPASPDTVDIYIYYGNDTATTTSDGNATFEEYINFNNYTIQSHAGSQDADSSQYQVLDNGTTLRMWGNNWKSVSEAATVNGDGSQVLEWWFDSDGVQGEINGIGLNDTNNLESSRHYKIWGTQSWGITGDDTYSGSNNWELMTQILDDYSANSNYFVFSNDADNGQATDVKFKNVRIRPYASPEPTHGDWGEEETLTDVIVSPLGTQTSSMTIPSTSQYVGGAFVITENTSSRNVTGVTITEHGTVNAQTNLANVKLYYELDTTSPYDCASESYNGTESQFGSATNFNGADGNASFSDTVGISTTSAMCVYVVLDVGSGASNNETLEIKINNPSTDVTVSSGNVGPSSAVEISGATTLHTPPDLQQIHYRWRNDDAGEGNMPIWYSSNWSYRKKITIDYTKVSGSSNFTNFPVLVSYTDPDLKTTANGGKVENSNGYDIIFTDDSSNKLDHEIERYDGSTGEIIMWVKVPILKYNEDTEIYIYYGNSNITSSQENVAAVWDDNYIMVQHLEEDPSTGTEPRMKDSNEVNDLTTSNLEAEDSVDAQIGKGIQTAEDTANPEYLIKNPASNFPSTEITVEFWIKSSGSSDGIVSYATSEHDNEWLIFNQANIAVYRRSNITTGISVNDNNWHHVVVTWRDSDNSVKVYKDGGTTPDYSGTLSADSIPGEGSLVLANEQDSVGGGWASGQHFTGILDEVRISNNIRSAEYIDTAYNNQANQGVGSGKFIKSLGSEETENTGATWAADEDTQLNGLAKNTIKRLRIEISNEGGQTASGTQYRLEVSEPNPSSCATASYERVSTDADWEMADSTYFTDGSSTGNVSGGLTDENSEFVTGELKDTGDQTSGITLATTQFTEIEYSIRATTSATDGATYCFRLTNAGSTTNFTYSQYAKVKLSGPPTVDSVSISPSPINLNADSTTTITITATISDPDGCEDVFTNGSISGVFYDAAVEDDSCTADDNDCYPNLTFTEVGDSCSGAGDTTGDAQATIDVWFHANASNQWTAKVTATDSQSQSGSNTQTVTINELAAFKLDVSNIDYGTVNPNEVSAEKAVKITTTGNVAVDVKLSGTDLTWSSYIIPVGQQKYSSTTGFDWETQGTALTTSPTCYELSTGKPTQHPSNQSEYIYWKLKVPLDKPAETYSGNNSFDVVSDSACP